MGFCHEIQQKRQQLRLSQAELAKKAHVTQAMISKLESGKDVRLSTLLAVTAALGLTLRALDEEQLFRLKRLESSHSSASWLDQYGVSDDD